MTTTPWPAAPANATNWAQLDNRTTALGDLAEEYHEVSKLYQATHPGQVYRHRLDSRPDLAQHARHGARDLGHLPRIALPPIDFGAGTAATAPLMRGPSCRDFIKEPMDPATLGQLLGLSYGVGPATAGPTRRRRPTASAGALYPLQLYVLTDVRGLGAPGIYHYDIYGHTLSELSAQAPPDSLIRLGAQPEVLRSAPLVLIICGLFSRSRFKYGPRGYRFALLEAGALLHQVHLVASALGLGSVPFAGLYDDVVEELCELDGADESFINAVLIGRPRTDIAEGTDHDHH